MADEPARRVALVSIHPRHAHAILAGTKRVELRRTPVASDVSHVLLYATAPVRAVIGWFEVEHVIRTSKSQLWASHGSVSGVTRREFRAYFAGASQAFGIVVGRVGQLDRPVPLEHIPGVRRPPQSFQYVDHLAVAWIIGDGEPSTCGSDAGAIAPSLGDAGCTEAVARQDLVLI